MRINTAEKFVRTLEEKTDATYSDLMELVFKDHKDAGKVTGVSTDATGGDFAMTVETSGAGTWQIKIDENSMWIDCDNLDGSSVSQKLDRYGREYNYYEVAQEMSQVVGEYFDRLNDE
jgi:hypothetical protein